MELCKHLSYVRSLSPGKAVFFYTAPERNFVPLRVDVARVLGQKCGFSEGFNAPFEPKAQNPHELAYGNPQTIETCYVPPNVDEIFCRFSLRVEANALSPRVCSDIDAMQTLVRLARCYQERGGFIELARRYSRNLLMATWLWRNRHNLGTRVEVRTSQGSSFVIDDVRHLDWQGQWPTSAYEQWLHLADELATALTQSDLFWFADITAALKTGFCQEIYPSQVFKERPDNRAESSKVLATVECMDGQLAACLTAQKVGAALQKIDDWWGEEIDEPLRVHEYAADPKHQTSMRHPVSGIDFYHLLSRADEMVAQMESSSESSTISREVHYLMAVLVKGGLFQKGKNQ